MTTNTLTNEVSLRKFLGFESRDGAKPAKSAAAGSLTRVSDRFPDCALQNHRGEKRRFRTDLVRDQRVLISFIYTRCEGICPRTMAGLREAYEQLKREKNSSFRMLSITVDPKRDTVADLMDYAVDNWVSDLPDWELLVGSEADTLAIRQALGAAEKDPAKREELKSHSGLVIFGNDRTNRWNAIPAGVAPIHIAQAFQRITREGSFSDLIKITRQ